MILSGWGVDCRVEPREIVVIQEAIRREASLIDRGNGRACGVPPQSPCRRGDGAPGTTGGFRSKHGPANLRGQPIPSPAFISSQCYTIVNSAATSSSVCARTQPPMQWMRPAQKSSRHACCAARIVSIMHPVEMARRSDTVACNRSRALSAVEADWRRYSSPSAAAASGSVYIVIKG